MIQFWLSVCAVAKRPSDRVDTARPHARTHFSLARPHLLAALFFLLTDAKVALAQRNFNPDAPEFATSVGDNEDDAISNALRRAVSQRCGERLNALTTNSTKSTKSKTISGEEKAAVAYSNASDLKNDVAVSTGGIIKRYKVLESQKEADNQYRARVEVYVEKCLVEDAGKITLKGQDKPKSVSLASGNVDKKKFVTRDVTITVAYEMPSVPVDSYSLREIAIAAGRSFATQVAKSELARSGGTAGGVQPTDIRIELTETRELPSNEQDYALEIHARVTMFGVSAQIDGSSFAGAQQPEITKLLRLPAKYSQNAGFSFYMNGVENSAIVFDVDKRGPSFGKIMRGDVITSINSRPIRIDDRFPVIFDGTIANGPTTLLLKRGNTTSIAVIRTR